MANAQWKTTTYTLKGGWNAIYLTGDATQDTLDNLLPSTVLEVWRWQPNPTQVGFTQSPLIPSSGTAEWSVWKRGVPAESSLTQLAGQMAYLVKCTGTISNTYSVAIKQTPILPTNSWVRNGANLLGFPSYKNGSSYPTLSSYFATFPAAIAVSSKVYKYVGGDLGAGNPIQIFSTNTERLDSTQAYWFSAEVTGDFYAPLEINPSSSDGFAFGRDGSVVKLLVRNRSDASVTLTLAPVASESAPAGQAGIVGAVPLTKRAFNATSLQWTETPITASYTVAVGPNSTVELSFGINRSDAMMSAASSDALFASLLRVTDSSNLMDVYVPVTAQKASLAGLWVGDVSLTNVSNKVSNGAQATATLTDGVITDLTVVGSGGFGYTSPPVVTIAPPHANSNVTATANATIDASGLVTAVTPVTGGSGYAAPPTVSFADPAGSTATAEATVSATGNVTRINLLASGSNYVAVPSVTIDPPPVSVAATGTAVVSGNKTIASISSDTGGSFYTTVPMVTIAPPTPNTATATALTQNGTLASLTVNNAGSDYTAVPSVGIEAPPASAQATAVAVVSATKTISRISQSSGGGYYLTAPTVTIAAPPASVTATANATVAAGVVSGITANATGTNYSVAPTVTIAASAASVTGNATATVSGGGVTGIVVNTAGSYYATAPVVTVAAPPASVTATANATFTGNNTFTITKILSGSNYNAVPNATLTGGGGSGANVTVSLGVTAQSFKINSGDKVYSVAPNVAITGGGGSGATGNATLTSGKVTGVTISAMGTGFTTAPSLAFSAGTVTSGTVSPTAVGNDSQFAVSTITKGGTNVGYTSAPTVTIAAPAVAKTANATATVANGGITAITVNNAGSGYSTAPTLSIAAPPTRVTATANSTLSGDGVASFTITNPGMGYASAPVVTLSAPPAAVTANATADISGGVVTAYTITNVGSNYATAPAVTMSGGSFRTPVQAVANCTLSGSGVATYNITNVGAGYTTAPVVTMTAPPSGTQATANATLTNGLVTGFTITNVGSLYNSPPAVTVDAPPAGVQATATCVLNGGSGINSGVSSAFTLTNPGSGYPSPPNVTIGGSVGVPAQAVATISNGVVTGYTVTAAGSGYPSAPTVVVAGPPANAQATATATVDNGSVTGFTVTSGGSGYEKAPAVIINLPPPRTGTSTPTPFKLRTLLHLSDGGTARLLSEVYLGQLAVAPNDVGLCTSESLLKQDALASAQCFSSSHMPMDQVITSGSGSLATGQTLTRVIDVSYNNATNPFVHAYHPDHDNKNARGEDLAAGVEAPNITRTCQFIFTATPPAGSTTTIGWGSSVIGGNYIETMTGVHKDPLILSGTFELRRASQIGTLSQ
ncbi:MAG: hypothetical protein ORN51_05370 [Akkermansiaceae bacterium]|nr:hypothetical protein [Akkermansiaceae bacterium]